MSAVIRPPSEKRRNVPVRKPLSGGPYNLAGLLLSFLNCEQHLLDYFGMKRLAGMMWNDNTSLVLDVYMMAARNPDTLKSIT
jgi:hypothetical protein